MKKLQLNTFNGVRLIQKHLLKTPKYVNNNSLFAIILIISINCSIFSQGISINENNILPDSSAILDVSSNKKGLLIPRMEKIERDAIISPALSLLIYNTTTDCFEFYAYGVWHEISCAVVSSGCGGLTTLTDSRDGKVYNIVEIGTQCWMAENLNYGTYVTAATGQGGIGTQKYCYDDNENNCDICGGLYEWIEVMNGAYSSSSTPSGVQGICPDGWHLPSHDEWTTLERAVCTSGGDTCETEFPYNTTTAGWQGTDEGQKLAGNEPLWEDEVLDGNGSGNYPFGDKGFMALPSGISWSGSFNGLSYYTYWWLATEVSVDDAWLRQIDHSLTSIRRGNFQKYRAFSVRCLKN